MDIHFSSDVVQYKSSILGVNMSPLTIQALNNA